MTLRSLDDYIARGSSPSDLKPGDRVLLTTGMWDVHHAVIKHWPMRVLQAHSAEYLTAESLPLDVNGKLTVVSHSPILIRRSECLGPWRSGSHCESKDCLDLSHYLPRSE